MSATPERVLGKFRKLHKKLGGYDRVVSLLKFTNAIEDQYIQSTTIVETTTVDPPPVIKDKFTALLKNLGDPISAAFAGGMSDDQRIFIFLADSFVTRLPIETLSERCEDFLFSRKGQDKGGILYGKTIYTIERITASPIIGKVAARYFVLARAQKQVGS